ncbi:hypothetical protein [Microcoleus sp. F4-D5]|uniref:hypothetical protein n=1 Tax=Microcoleus sp. F4-D5 TaxID=2818760 RepID=UPI002FD42585
MLQFHSFRTEMLHHSPSAFCGRDLLPTAQENSVFAELAREACSARMVQGVSSDESLTVEQFQLH